MGAKKLARAIVVCSYQRLRGRFFNAGGALPCNTCPACKADREALERVKRWNEDTRNGANPRR